MDVLPDALSLALTHQPGSHDVCRSVAALMPAMRARADALDRAAAFPGEDILALKDAGVLLAPFPAHAGGWGLGAADMAELLRLLGRGNLALGRLIEAHVNAAKLIALYGSERQIARAAADAAAGRMAALWVTDPAEEPLHTTDGHRLRGGKAFCSGAGHVCRVVATVTDPGGDVRLAYLGTEGSVATPLAQGTQGMRAAITGRVSFEGCRIGDQDWIGEPADYLREPHFSAGAWRTSAVTWGGMEALVEEAMRHLVARRRETDPHQCARMGRAWIAQETAGMWVRRAAHAAEAATAGAHGDEVVATVNFARLAVEAACLEVLQLVERSVGLAAFTQPSAIERIRRDLGTYLRQPAADEALTEAAAHVMRDRMGGR